MKLSDDLTGHMLNESKRLLSDRASQLMAAGIPDTIVMAALFSIGGNLIGLNFPAEQWPSILESMKLPVMNDAKRAAALKASLPDLN